MQANKLSRLELAIACAAAVVCGVPVFAATAAEQSEQGSTAIVPQDTGVGPRGTKVAPSTDAAAPAPIDPSQTGVLPRGNKAAESTPPPAGNSSLQ